MWLYILLTSFGIAALVFGIAAARRTGKKIWYLFTAAGAAAVLSGVFFSVCALLFVNRVCLPPESGNIDSGESVVTDTAVLGEAGGDWRTWRGYSNEDYMITDELSICFAALDDGCGYGVYDASDGTRIGTVIFDEGEEPEPSVEWISKLEDHNGDSANDLGILLTDGAFAWFCYDKNLLYAWPEPVSGCFPRERG